MRFFEFKLPEPGTDLAKQVDAELKDIVDIINQNPAAEKKVNAKLQAILDFTKKTASNQKTPTAGINPPPEETKEELFSESTATLSLVDAINAQITATIDKAARKAALKMLNDLKKTISQEFAAERQAGRREEFATSKALETQLINQATILSKKISGSLDAMKEQYDEQVREGDLQAPKKSKKSAEEVKEELIDLIKGIFSKPISQSETPEDRDETAKRILEFMKRCVTGVFSFNALLERGRGSVFDLINAEDKKVLDMMNNALLKAKPGKTAGNWGPGELGLAILGDPVRKGKKGDLQVGDKQIELKASQNPKAGGRFGTTALQNGLAGKADYESALLALLSAAKYKTTQLSLKSGPNYVGNYKTKKGDTKDISHLNFGDTFIKVLNDRIKDRVSPDTTVAFLTIIAKACIIDTYEKKVNTGWIKKCANPDGTINYNKFLAGYSAMLFSLYQEIDGVREIMVFNPISGAFHVINEPGDLISATEKQEGFFPVQFSTNIINFSDTQGKASPQIGI